MLRTFEGIDEIVEGGMSSSYTLIALPSQPHPYLPPTCHYSILFCFSLYNNLKLGVFHC